MTLRAGVRRCSRKSEVEVRCATDVCVDIRKSLFFCFFLRRAFTLSLLLRDKNCVDIQ